jgi:acetate kinase
VPKRSRVLVLNAGSSTLKASVVELRPGLDPAVEPPRPLVAETVEWGSDATRAEGRASDLSAVLERFADAGLPAASLAAVGHRVVHGGDRFTAPTLLSASILDELDALSPLAPLHNPVALEAARIARELLPGLPHVAAFDTAFHATLPEAARRYAIPASWVRDHGIRRYGFHGLSVAWSVARAAVLLGRATGSLRLLVAHLGSGCSVTAVESGRSVDTSMGFTPLEGLVMGTRSGSIDPGILLHLLRTGAADPDALAEALDHGSGLLGVSGVSGDVRDVRTVAGNAQDPRAPRAQLALDLFARSAARWIAAMATSLDGPPDALVFTAGIGEHDAAMRAAILARLGGLGFAPLAPDARAEGSTAEREGASSDVVLAQPDHRPAVLRVAAREDLVIAAAAAGLA